MIIGLCVCIDLQNDYWNPKVNFMPGNWKENFFLTLMVFVYSANPLKNVQRIESFPAKVDRKTQL